MGQRVLTLDGETDNQCFAGVEDEVDDGAGVDDLRWLDVEDETDVNGDTAKPANTVKSTKSHVMALRRYLCVSCCCCFS